MLRFIRSAIAVLALGAPMAFGDVSSARAAGYFVDRPAYVVGVGGYDVLNMRAWPAAYSRRVGAIPHHGSGIYVQRCIVRPHGSSSDWCKVRFGGTWGWVNKRYIAYH